MNSIIILGIIAFLIVFFSTIFWRCSRIHTSRLYIDEMTCQRPTAVNSTRQFTTVQSATTTSAPMSRIGPEQNPQIYIIQKSAIPHQQYYSSSVQPNRQDYLPTYDEVIKNSASNGAQRPFTEALYNPTH